MRNCVEGFGEVENYHIYLGTNVKLPKEVLDCCNQLRLTGVSRSEAMLEFCSFPDGRAYAYR